MTDAKLLTSVTRYGGPYHRLSDVLYYESDRTVAQYKKMRMHPICWLGLNFIKLGLPDVPFIIECDEDEDARLITEKMMKKIWRKLIKESTESLDFGFKAMEIRYEVGDLKYYGENEDLQTFEGILLKSPKGLDGETIEILIEQDGSFRGFWQDYEVERTCLAEDKKALVFTHNLESGNYYGISAMEPVYPYWYDANLNRQFHMRWLERIGTGLFKGRYPTGKQKVDNVETDNQEIMLDLLDGIMEGTHVAIPSGTDDKGNYVWDIEILSTEDRTDPFVERARYIDETILKGLIIPEKALTQGEVGARASIEAFQDMFVQRKQSILDDIVDTIDRYLLPAFTEVNFGKELEIHVRSGQLGDDSIQTANEIVKKLIETGKEKVEQQWLIDKTGIPLEEREEIEEIEELPEDMETEIESDEDEEMPEDEKKKPEEDEKKEDKKEFADNRYKAMNKREAQFNMADFGGYLDDQSSLFKEAMTTEIMRQEERVKKYLDKNYSKASEGKYIDIVNGISIQSGPIRKIIKGYLNNIYSYSYEVWRSGTEGRKFAKTDSSSKFIGFRAELTGSKMATDLESDIKYQVSNDLESQLSKPELLTRMTQRIRDFLSSHLSTISETELGFTLGKSNDDYFLMNNKLVNQGKLDPGKRIERFQFSAILDGVTTDLCRNLYTKFGAGGLIVEAGSPIKAQYNTPLHFNCFVPETKVFVPKRSQGKTVKREKQIKNIKIGDKVLSGTGEYREVVEVHRQFINDEIIEIELENDKRINVTKNHKFLTQRGWVKAGNLLETDDIKEVPKTLRKYKRKINLPYEYFYQEYIIKKKSSRQIGEELGIGAGTVIGYLKQYNIKIRYGSDAIKNQWTNNSERRKQQSILARKRQKGNNNCLGIKRPDASERMKKNNPVHDRKVIIKTIKTKLKNGTLHQNSDKFYKHGKRKDLDDQYFRSSWEANFARVLNYNNVKWEFENKTFFLSDGLTYTPDFYLPEQDKYIEIKGYWREDAKAKFNMFLKEYPEINISLIDSKAFKDIKKQYKDKLENWE